MADAESSSRAAEPAASPPIVATCSELIVQVDHDGRVIHHGDGPCPVCCPWTLIFHRPQRTYYGVTAPMFYQEWLVYHLHVVRHQRLDLATLPAVLPA